MPGLREKYDRSYVRRKYEFRVEGAVEQEVEVCFRVLLYYDKQGFVGEVTDTFQLTCK